MTCRHCGTDIADNALVCYRCGTATTPPQHAPGGRPRPRSMGSLVATALALVLIVVAALYLGRTPADSTSRLVTWVIGAVAVAIVVLRAYARRR